MYFGLYNLALTYMHTGHDINFRCFAIEILGGNMYFGLHIYNLALT